MTRAIVHASFGRASYALRAAALSLAAVVAAAPDAARGLDWAGKFQQDVQDLRSPSAELRLRAVRRIGRYPIEQAKKFLLQALGDADVKVRLEAASQVAEHKLREATPALLGWLSHWEMSLRTAAADALGKIADPRAARALIRALSDLDPEVRLKVVVALGQIDTKDRVEIVPLLGRLNNDTDTNVRKAAVDALARKKDGRALIALIGRLADTSHEVRQAAVLALGELANPRAGPSLLRMVRDSNASVAASAIEVLGKLRYEPAVEALIDLMQNGSYANRGAAASALGAIATPAAIRALVAGLAKTAIAAAAKRALVDAGNRAAAPLTVLLRNPRTASSVGALVVEISHEAKMSAAVPALIEQLRIGRLPRLQIIRALGHIADPRAQRPLLEMLDQASYEIRLATLDALDHLLDERAAEPLLQLLADPSPRIKLTAVEYLGRLRSRAATPALLKLALARDPLLARSAVAALAQSRDPRAAAPLVPLLRHREQGMRRLAAQTLARLRQASTVDAILRICHDPQVAVKVTCYQALGGVLRGSSHEQAYTLLARAAGENDRSLFLAAVDALAAMRDRRIAPLLSRRYAIVDVPLKRKLLEALGQPDAENTALAVTLLLRALVEPELTLRATAAWSLGKHAGQLGSNAAAAEAALERAARDSAWQVRTNAAAALARLRPTKLRSLLRALAGESTPYVRANAILAMAWSADPEAAATAAARLRTDRSPWVRANAVRVLHALRTPDILLSDARKIPTAAKLVEVIAAEDPDPRVRLVAGHLRHPQRGEEGRWIGLYVLDQEEKPLRNDLFMFVAPGGLARAAWSDGLGEAWEEGVDDGLCFVELSPPAPPSAHHAP